MAAGGDGVHEPWESLPETSRNMHRALASLMEELEAVDWYQQRADGCTDEELARILAHNMDEEKEHAAMILEWLRRNDAAFAGKLDQFLNRPGSILEQESGPAEGEGGAGDGSLGIGSLARSAE